MLKILVHTMHMSTSIGASLQACALCKKLFHMGYAPELLYYVPPFYSNVYNKTRPNVNSIRSFISSIINYKNIEGTRLRFVAFKNQYHPNLYGKFSALDEVSEASLNFDAYICGSDQVWNPYLTRFDMSYFFPFVKNKAPKVSYAASIGRDNITSEHEKFLRQGLSHMNHIGVREDAAVDIIKHLCPDKPVTQNIDPTFLLNKDEWMAMASPLHTVLPHEYILYYPMGKITAEGTRILLELKKKYALQCASFSSSFRKPAGVDINLCGLVGPGEFLQLCNNAKIILTNSFHGMALALIFRKKLICFGKYGQNSRLESLSRLLNVQKLFLNDANRFITQNWDEIWAECYVNIETVIAKEQHRADEYLRRSIEQHE